MLPLFSIGSKPIVRGRIGRTAWQPEGDITADQASRPPFPASTERDRRPCARMAARHRSTGLSGRARQDRRGSDAGDRQRAERQRIAEIGIVQHVPADLGEEQDRHDVERGTGQRVGGRDRANALANSNKAPCRNWCRDTAVRRARTPRGWSRRLPPASHNDHTVDAVRTAAHPLTVMRSLTSRMKPASSSCARNHHPAARLAAGSRRSDSAQTAARSVFAVGADHDLRRSAGRLRLVDDDSQIQGGSGGSGRSGGSSRPWGSGRPVGGR